MKRRTIIFLVVIAVVIGLAIFFIVRNKNKSNGGSGTNGGNGSGTPVLTEFKQFYPYLWVNGETVWHDGVFQYYASCDENSSAKGTSGAEMAGHVGVYDKLAPCHGSTAMKITVSNGAIYAINNGKLYTIQKK